LKAINGTTIGPYLSVFLVLKGLEILFYHLSGNLEIGHLNKSESINSGGSSSGGVVVVVVIVVDFCCVYMNAHFRVSQNGTRHRGLGDMTTPQ